jgi:iron complex transport system ATP-binding protein
VSVLHEIGLALHADDLLLLQDGRVAHHGAAAEAATHRAIEAVFDQRVRVHPVAGRWVALPREAGE